MIWSLADSTAVSSFAPGAFFTTIGAKVDLFHMLADLCPSCHYHTNKDTQAISDLMLGDGADIENNGVIPLLRRRVERIMVGLQDCINFSIGKALTNQQAVYKKKHPKASSDVVEYLGFGDSTASLFGLGKCITLRDC